MGSQYTNGSFGQVKLFEYSRYRRRERERERERERDRERERERDYLCHILDVVLVWTVLATPTAKTQNTPTCSCIVSVPFLSRHDTSILPETKLGNAGIVTPTFSRALISIESGRPAIRF